MPPPSDSCCCGRATLHPSLLYHAPRPSERLAHLLDYLRVRLNPQLLRPRLHIRYQTHRWLDDHGGNLLRTHARALLAEGSIAGPQAEGLGDYTPLRSVQYLRKKAAVLLHDGPQLLYVPIHRGVLLVFVGLHEFAIRSVVGPRWWASTLACVSPGVATT